MTVLFIGPLPEPVTGQSLACQVFLDELQKKYNVDVINLSKSTFRQGVNSLARIREVLSFAWQAARKSRSASSIYFTVSESFAGNLKDMLIYAACFGKLDKMAIHLHGGAGMRQIMNGKYPLLARLNRFFLRRIGAIIVLGERHVSIYDGIDPSRIRIVPNFAQDHLFANESSIDEKFNNPSRLKLLFLSNLLPGKGYKELVQAYASLSSEYQSRISIDFAGGFEADEHRDEFVKAIKGLPGITYHGSVQGAEKQRLLAEAHIFCLPTYYPYEGQPISILEGYASGCAVITTDHSGIFDTFTPGRNGLEVEKQSVQSLRAAIEQAADSIDLVHKMAKNNLEDANRYYRVEIYNKRLEAIINEVHHKPDVSGAPRQLRSIVE